MCGLTLIGRLKSEVSNEDTIKYILVFRFDWCKNESVRKECLHFQDGHVLANAVVRSLNECHEVKVEVHGFG